MGLRSQHGMHTPMETLAERAPMLSAERERELAERASAGDERAFDELVSSHLRLVYSIARQYERHSPSAEDLVAEGTLGLVEATRRFELSKGARLAAYAAWWIRAYMRRYTLSARRIVRAPASRDGRKLIFNLRKAQRELAKQDGSAPDSDEVAALFNVDQRTVEEVDAYLSGRDVACGLDDEGRGYEAIDREPTPEAALAEEEERAQSKHALHAAMERLDAREQRILQQRFLSPERKSLSAIGEEMELSREWVRQLERQARDKVRQSVLASVA